MKTTYGQIAATAYDFWRTRRGVLFGGVALFLLLVSFYCLTLSFSNDIQSMLPDKDARFREDFELFSYSPFSRNVLISLELTDSDNSDGRLEKTAQRIVAVLQPPHFQRAVCGISQEQKIRLFTWVYGHLPSLVGEVDIERIREKIAPATIRRQMEENIRILHGPESIFLKEFILQDPLAFRELLLDKFLQLNVVSAFSPESDYFLSHDNRHLLILAETDVPILDYRSGSALLDELYGVLDLHVPDGMRYAVICGHRYTVANAETIQSDLRRVLGVSFAGLFIIFMVFLRHRRAVAVFFIPPIAFAAGIAATGLFFSQVSAITVGFGAVLLGISADFGLHVFFGFQRRDRDVRQTLTELTKPLLFCALTTIGVFSALLFSALPGQRQLAVFSIAGILTALVLSLFVLPHLIPEKPVLPIRSLPLPRARKCVGGIWLLVLILSLLPASRITFDGDLKRIGMIPQDVLNDELHIKTVWGGIREQAILFAIGQTEEESLQKNDQLYYAFKTQKPDAPLLSAAALLPSLKTQQANLARWEQFWDCSEQGASFRNDIEAIGSEYGFAPDAFEAFYTWIENPQKEFTMNDFVRKGNETIIAPFMTRLRDGQYAALSFVPEENAVLSWVRSMELDTRVVSNQEFSAQLNRETAHDFIQFFSSAIVLIVVLLLLFFGDIKKTLLAFMPVVCGILLMAAIMSILGLNITLFNMAASILVIGLAVDYGIFMVCSSEKNDNDATRNAVLVSGLTTFAGFGALILARHPSLYSIGVTVAIGIIPALLCALTLLPCLLSFMINRKPQR